MMSGEFVRFLSTGGFAALVNLVQPLCAQQGDELRGLRGDRLSHRHAHGLRPGASFRVSGERAVGRLRIQALRDRERFFACFCVVISVGLAKYLFPAMGFVCHAEDVAHFIGVAAPAVASYFAHRAYTFSR